MGELEDEPSRVHAIATYMSVCVSIVIGWTTLCVYCMRHRAHLRIMRSLARRMTLGASGKRRFATHNNYNSHNKTSWWGRVRARFRRPRRPHAILDISKMDDWHRDWVKKLKSKSAQRSLARGRQIDNTFASHNLRRVSVCGGGLHIGWEHWRVIVAHQLRTLRNKKQQQNQQTEPSMPHARNEGAKEDKKMSSPEKNMNHNQKDELFLMARVMLAASLRWCAAALTIGVVDNYYQDDRLIGFNIRVISGNTIRAMWFYQSETRYLLWFASVRHCVACGIRNPLISVVDLGPSYNNVVLTLKEKVGFNTVANWESLCKYTDTLHEDDINE